MIRIRDSKWKTTLKAAFLLCALLLIAVGSGFGQAQVNLTAGPTTTTLPDGSVVPMWGYTCGAAVTGSTATCAPLNPSSGAGLGALGGVYVISGGTGYAANASGTTLPVTITPNQTVAPTTAAVAYAVTDSKGEIVAINVTNHGAGYTAAPTVTVIGGSAVLAAAPAWSPIEITVPSGTVGGLQINLTNNLSFGAAAGQSIPTSMVIVGQVGGGLGGAPTTTTSPSHANAQGCVSWFIAALPPGTPCTSNQSGAYPPTQGPRIQSMGAEVAAVAPGSGTPANLTWQYLKPGTYLLESGTHPSIQVPMGLIGMLVVTTPPSGATAGTAYPSFTPATNATAAAQAPVTTSITYGGEVPFEFSEIDPVQNRAVDIAVRNSAFSETRVWSGLPTDPQGNAGCGNPASGSLYQSCYPPAVNYTPFYFLINGQAFDKTNPSHSLFPATAGTAATSNSSVGCTVSATVLTCPVTTGITGNVLVRLVNAGLKMHVPAIVNSQTNGFTGAGVLTTASNPVGGFTLIAEDGNPIPNLAAPRVKTEVFMAAGKTYDVMLNLPTASLALYDREGSLSANSSIRDAGMLAYLGVNGSALPIAAGTGAFAAATANPDSYPSIACTGTGTGCLPLVITDPSKGVIANDVNVYGVALAVPPSSGVLTCTAVPGNPVDGICPNGTFTYSPNATWAADTFTYCANGTTPSSPTPVCTTVSVGASNLTGGPTAINQTFNSKIATFVKIPSPGLLLGNSDANNLTLNVVVPATTPALTNVVGVNTTGASVVMDRNGGFVLSLPSNTAAGAASFSYTVTNSQGKTASGTATVNFPAPSNVQIHVLDAQAFNSCNGDSACIGKITPFTDYRWIIEEDQTFYVDPNCTTNSSVTTAGCPSPMAPGATIPTFGTNFHTSTMPFVAQGCTGPLSCEGGQTMLDPTTGNHVAAVCDLGNGACRPDPTGNGFTPVLPGSVHLDPSKRYYISVLPGDAANPFPGNTSTPTCNGKEAGLLPANQGGGLDTSCGHTMSGAEIAAQCNILGGTNGCATTTATPYAQAVNVLVLPTPLPTGQLSVLVFEDDFPLNGEQDSGGGSGAVAPLEPGLGGFNLVLWDTFGGLGDFTGQDTNDMFNQSLGNSLSGSIDPVTGNDACPIAAQATADPTQAGITGMIVTCPKYESDGATLSPLAGQAIIVNLMPDKFSVQAYPGADRIARGEQWVQTNTLDGQHPHDAFIPIGGPAYFQEYGPAGYHVMIGFANPAIINARHDDVCNGLGSPGSVGPCTNTINGQVDVQRISRTPDQRLYPSGSRDALAWTQCWVSLGDPDGEDFEFTFCDANGNFSFANVPGGNWRITLGDQWNDQIVDGLSIPANVGCTTNGALSNQATACPGGQTLNLGNIGAQQWQSNLNTRTFIDDNKDGIWESDEIGIPLIYTMIHYRDGHNANALTTDFNGIANFNETFPLFNWYVVEADSTRYKTTGIHTVYDAGGPADNTSSCTGGRPCGTSTAYTYLSNTAESVPLPSDLSVPGSVYCTSADCATEAASYAAGTAIKSSGSASTGRIDTPLISNGMEGFSGLTGTTNWIEIGKAPYATGENGGIYGNVTYASTRPFDDASQMIQQPWEPNVPGVTVNLYQEGFAADGVTPTLKLVDTTVTGSWDAWAQGFYPGATAGTSGGAATTGSLPYMNCPGQGQSTGTNADVFFFTLFDQPNYLDWYNVQHNGGTLHQLAYNAQYKCYDSMHIGNQLQPAPYDGKYFFPSQLGIDPTTGKMVAVKGSTNGVASSMNGTNCTICVPNPTVNTGVPTTDPNYDPYRAGTPMLPPGKYVVETIMPAGYEVYKEEDKNLLIGDNFIAPAVQEFAGLGGAVFILPDQASVASMYDETGAGYNPTNYQNSTTGTGLADELSGVPGFPGYTDPVWPCVGEMRIVPDYLSLFPQNLETAPFAGATRPLCDRKEVTLGNQMAVNARFFIFTSTHIAGKYTGVITDDYTSEFDPFSPQFGEKFGPPNMPVSTKDYLGNELSRVYSDHWGAYNGLTFSSWDVNPPNITGYSPAMMTQCMNDPGPITGANGQLVTDPLFSPMYSNFCYIDPYMPGVTTYNDTPVVPTTAFVGAGYNNVDCSYPDATPAIAEVDSSDGIGPWVSSAATGKTLTITALGDQQVNNSAYSGPSANVPPFNMKTITRHYGFGSRCTAVGTGCTAVSSVTIGGASATINSWTDTSITVAVPATFSTTSPNGVPLCSVQQQVQYGGPGTVGGKSPTNTSNPSNKLTYAYCGELVVTAGNGKQSIDTVTVTIGGKAPTHVAATASIQGAIDAAKPGDLIMIDPTCTNATGVVSCETSATNPVKNPAVTNTAVAAHTEMLLMWKPVRLQGVGAASSVIDANAFPSGKLLNPWRRHVNCLFGLSLQGVPLGSFTAQNPAPQVFDPTGTYSCPEANWTYYGSDLAGHTGGQYLTWDPQIDRIPLESVVGWDASLNGNLAEQLQEPSLMGAYEGAGITVLGKGVAISQTESPWTDGSAPGAFPLDALLLQDVPPAIDDAGAATPAQVSYCFTLSRGRSTTTELEPNLYPSNYECNPSSIDGLTIRDSSQGGGGIFVHGWAHNLQIANNRVYNNAGTLSGGISVGQGEFPTLSQMVATGASPAIGQFTQDYPPSCQNGTVVGQLLPGCLDLNVNVHHNDITANSSLGDELFSGTLAGGGGVSFCTGDDYYKFQYNWVCGNLSSAEGGGVAHLGHIWNGDIEHNTIVLNQSTNPTIATNGGGLMIMGTPDTDPTCGTQNDQDCPPGLSDGTGPGLVVNANLIQANTAESGAGAGIRMQQVNGTDISTFPTGCVQSNGLLGSSCSGGKKPASSQWNSVAITNNIIVNNVAGWDGAGISLEDALNVSIINNTIASNDSLASSGVLIQSLGAPDSSAPTGTCVLPNGQGTVTTQASCPQSAGVTAESNDPLLVTSMSGLTITCPTGMPNCQKFSNPLLENNLVWQNRSFILGISAGPTTGTGNQQNVVQLFDAFSGTPSPVQSTWGACATGVSYWDLGVRGDTGPTNHTIGTLNPTFSVMDSTTGYAASNSTSNPTFANQYCNGPRVPPTCSVANGCGGPGGYGVPAGIADATTPNPRFTLTPSATVDEGNNWVNVSWGPMALSDDSTQPSATSNWGSGPAFANYAPTSTSANIVPQSNLPTATYPALKVDFLGTTRPTTGNVTAGAIELTGGGSGGSSTFTVSPSTLAFGSQAVGSTSTTQNVTVTNTGSAALAGGTFTITTGAPFNRVTTGTFPTGAPNCGGALALGASCTIKVDFAPTTTTGSPFSSSLTVAYTGATGSGTPVTLTGTATPAPGTLHFQSATNATLSGATSGSTLTFTVGTSRAAVQSVVTIVNAGGTNVAITADSLLVGGSRFAINSTTCLTASPLAANATCTVTVTYTPPASAPILPNLNTLDIANNGTGTTLGASFVILSGK